MTSRYDILLGRVPDEIDWSDTSSGILLYVGPRRSGRTTAICQEIQRFVDDWCEGDPPCLVMAPDHNRTQELVHMVVNSRRTMCQAIRAKAAHDARPWIGRKFGAVFVDDLNECSLTLTRPLFDHYRFIRASILRTSVLTQELVQRGARIINLTPEHQWVSE